MADSERFVATPLNMETSTFRSFRLRAISKLTFSGQEWLIDGQPLETVSMHEFDFARNSERDTRLFTFWTLRNILKEERAKYQGDEYPLLSELRAKVVAVAWVEEKFDDFPEHKPDPDSKPIESYFGEKYGWVKMVEAESPHAKAFHPIFLSAFHSIGEPFPESPEKSASDWFTSYAAAAKYAGVTERTIKNWKSRGWLKVEQNKRLIRIARDELDKCNQKH